MMNPVSLGYCLFVNKLSLVFSVQANLNRSLCDFSPLLILIITLVTYAYVSCVDANQHSAPLEPIFKMSEGSSVVRIWSVVAGLGTVALLAAISSPGLIRHSTSSTGRNTPRKKNNVAELIGDTPMVRVQSLSDLTGVEIYAKLELANPGGSAKDRVALAIIRDFEQKGLIKPGRGDVVFEGTSGSTGISIAMICNSLGYKAHICLPDDTGEEKLKLLESYNAVLEKVKPASIVDPNQYVNAARKGAEELTNDKSNDAVGVFANQFENDCNWRVHYATTAPEIWDQMDNDIDFFVTGSGTGGTIAGCSKYLKEQNPNIKVVLADPQGSGLFNRVKYGVMYDTVEREGSRRRHQVDTIVEGIGLTRLTHNFSLAEPYIDDSIRVTDDQAIKMAKYLCVNDGLFLGSSSCINAVAALKVAKNSAKKGDKLVFIACDSGNRHISKFWKEARNVPATVSIDEILS